MKNPIEEFDVDDCTGFPSQLKHIPPCKAWKEPIGKIALVQKDDSAGVFLAHYKAVKMVSEYA
jgi:hypothetical protein